jgi:uncharacterized protein (TIGR02145 family)
MNKLLLIALISFLLFVPQCTKEPKKQEKWSPFQISHGHFTDPRNNRTYKTVTIGKQTWMAENLDVGKIIPSQESREPHNDAKNNQVIEKFCYFNQARAGSVLGGLYEWPEAMQYDTTEGAQGICPAGWHIPTDKEWLELEAALGMPQDQLDSIGYRGTNQGELLRDTVNIGFNVIMAGIRNVYGSYTMQGHYFSTWTSSRVPSGQAWYRSILQARGTIRRDTCSTYFGKCIRCIKDKTP